MIDREDWPVHQPYAPEAPIPGIHHYGGCSDDYPRVRPDGICEDCGQRACPVCGLELCKRHSETFRDAYFTGRAEPLINQLWVGRTA